MAKTEARSRSAAAALAQAAKDLVIEASDDIRRAMWTKYASALSIQAVAMLTGGTNSQCVNDKAIFDLIVAVAREAYEVAASQGYGDLVFDIADMRARRVNSHHKPSMLQDIERGRVVELDAQYLVLQDIARQSGVATPLIDTITPLAVARARVAGCYPPV